jgi:hypothetical protein
MNSPSDGWLVSVPEPVVLHYDGGTWQQASVSNLLTANSASNAISIVDASDMWIITSRLVQQSQYAPVTGMQHYVGGRWQTVTWPFPDDEMIMPLTRTAPGDYWAMGLHEDGTDPSTMKAVLLQYVGGAWHEYGA